LGRRRHRLAVAAYGDGRYRLATAAYGREYGSSPYAATAKLYYAGRADETRAQQAGRVLGERTNQPCPHFVRIDVALKGFVLL
jgi:hypothetical protein